jgi:cytochrome c-type biogenesis protein CcmH
MRRPLSWALVAALVTAALALALVSGGGTGPGASAEQVAAELRCPVCQGLSVKDSDSPTARDIRSDIDRRLAAGESPGQIRQAYVDRYGQWILLRPRTSGFETLAWAIPAAVAAAAAVTLGAAFARWRRRGRHRTPTDADRDLVAAALARSAEDVEGAVQ